MAEYIEREVPWDDQYISKTDAIKLAAIIVVPFATSENIQDIHKTFERTIDKYPAADVQPVKHGRWRENELYGLKIYNCSYCNAPQWWNTDKYCHECGTKMDGEDNG